MEIGRFPGHGIHRGQGGPITMTTQISTLSRRHLLGGIGAAAALASLGGLARPLSAFDGHVLPFRKDAPELLLHFNENSLGMSPKAMASAQMAVQNKGNRYADDAIARLRSMIAESHNVAADQVIMGNGSTEAIRAVVTAAAQDKVTVIEPEPTFGDVRRYARAEGLAVVTVPVGAGFVTDLEAMRQAANTTPGPLLINICNPNNPTGTIVEQTALRGWIENAPANHLFLIDEAYFDYAKDSEGYESLAADVAAGRENIVVARTFSKVYGMAGMRVGYGIAAPETAKKIRPFAATYNLSAAGIAAAITSLEDTAFYEQSLASNREAKAILTDALNSLGLDYIPSHTNFLLHRIGSDLDSYQKRMRDNNIRVGRRMTREDGWNRLSIGTPVEMTEFVRTLRAFRANGWV